jgi:hypothetical protein
MQMLHGREIDWVRCRPASSLAMLPAGPLRSGANYDSLGAAQFEIHILALCSCKLA